MPKAIDLRLHGIKFEDAVKRMIAAPPPPSSKKAKAGKSLKTAAQEKVKFLLMKYPAALLPITAEAIALPSGSVQISKSTPVFKLWQGAPVSDSYGGKPVLDFYRRPEFAELGILRIFEQDGWEGVWVDTYRRKFRTQYWPPNEASLPKDRELFLKSINEAAGSHNGCFDVFCWKESDYVFVESKRSAQDRIQDTQKRWIQAALQCGVPLSSLLIVEWRIL